MPTFGVGLGWFEGSMQMEWKKKLMIFLGKKWWIIW